VLGSGLLREQAPAVSFHCDNLRPASNQHQQDESADEIKVDEGFAAGDPAVEGTKVGAGDANGDGQVDVNGPKAQALYGAAEEVATACQHAEGAKQHRECAEEPGILEILLHTKIHGEGEEHDVHGECCAETEPADEGAAFGFA
jgi:hypothetical protein